MLLLRFFVLLLLADDVAVVAFAVAATLAICFCTSPAVLDFGFGLPGFGFGRPPSRRRLMMMGAGSSDGGTAGAR